MGSHCTEWRRRKHPNGPLVVGAKPFIAAVAPVAETRETWDGPGAWHRAGAVAATGAVEVTVLRLERN